MIFADKHSRKKEKTSRRAASQHDAVVAHSVDADATDAATMMMQKVRNHNSNLPPCPNPNKIRLPHRQLGATSKVQPTAGPSTTPDHQPQPPEPAQRERRRMNLRTVRQFMKFGTGRRRHAGLGGAASRDSSTDDDGR